MGDFILKDGHDVFCAIGSKDYIFYFADFEWILSTVFLKRINCIWYSNQDQVDWFFKE